MALVDIGGFQLPFEWLIIGLAVFVGVVIFAFIVGSRQRKDTPLESSEIVRLPVSEGGTVQIGELISASGRDEDYLHFTHPDWKDRDGESVTIGIDVAQKIPVRFLDQNKTLHEMWLVLDRGELEVASVTDLLERVPERPDKLAANPRDVGYQLLGAWQGAKGLRELFSWTNLPVILMVLFAGVSIGVMVTLGLTREAVFK